MLFQNCGLYEEAEMQLRTLGPCVIQTLSSSAWSVPWGGRGR
jgi:hypothetical protein